MILILRGIDQSMLNCFFVCSYSDLKFELERSSGLEVLSVSDEFLKIRITSPVPTMQTNSPNHRGKYEHELAIKLDTTAMTVEAVQVFFQLQFVEFVHKFYIIS